MDTALLATARHEAAHAVGFLAGGLPLSRVEVIPGPGRGGCTLLEVNRELAARVLREPEWAQRWALGVACGPAADAVLSGKTPDVDTHSGYDQRKIAKLAGILAARGQELDVAAVAREALVFVRLHRTAIETVARALVQARRLDGGELRALLGAVDRPHPQHRAG